MNVRTLILSLLLFVTCTSVNAKGGIPILYSAGEEVEKVIDLPMREEYQIQAQDGRWYHADLGILHEQFSIFWVPLFNYGTEKYVLYTDQKIGEYDFTYADLYRDDIAYLQSEMGGIPSTPELPFWDAWGGKLLALLLIGIVILIKKAN